MQQSIKKATFVCIVIFGMFFSTGALSGKTSFDVPLGNPVYAHIDMLAFPGRVDPVMAPGRSNPRNFTTFNPFQHGIRRNATHIGRLARGDNGMLRSFGHMFINIIYGI